jgi:hypothetical protein
VESTAFRELALPRAAWPNIDIEQVAMKTLLSSLKKASNDFAASGEVFGDTGVLVPRLTSAGPEGRRSKDD